MILKSEIVSKSKRKSDFRSAKKLGVFPVFTVSETSETSEKSEISDQTHQTHQTQVIIHIKHIKRMTRGKKKFLRQQEKKSLSAGKIFRKFERSSKMKFSRPCLIYFM